MIKLEQLNNSHFIGNKCSIQRDSSDYLVVSSCINFLQAYIYTTNIVALPGKYRININLSTQNQVYWYGSYNEAKKIFLINGKNEFIIEITNKETKPFTIGIFLNVPQKGQLLILQNITITKYSDQENSSVDNTESKNVTKTSSIENNSGLQTSIKTLMGQKSRRKQEMYNKSMAINMMYKNNHKKYTVEKSMDRISHKPDEILTDSQDLKLENAPAESREKTKITQMVKATDKQLVRPIINNNKKNILLVIDVKNWCFDNITHEIKRYYDQYYNIYVECCMYNPDYQNYLNINFDIIIKFWYGYEKTDPFVIYPNATKIVCIYDYIHWNIHVTKPNNSQTYRNFIKNIEAADYILYSCPIIKKLLVEQYSTIIADKKLYPAFDGVNINNFYPKNYDQNDSKLVVGWVGNTHNVNKNFSIVSRTVKNVKWINFMVQDNINFIPHNEMIDFYNKIDVLVCLSNAEGTPNPILEASACAKPWISTNVGIVELLYNANDGVSENKPGIIINNWTELLPKLLFLHKNRNIMHEMGLIARKNVEKDFSWDQRIKSFGDIFEEIPIKQQIQTIQQNTLSVNIPNKIIITSTQYPRYGGAATCAYEMHKYLINKNIPSVCIFFDNSIKNKIALLNPDNLPNVYNESMPANQQNLHKYTYDKIRKNIYDIYFDEPYTIYSFNYFAPIISKHIFKNSMVNYMITGCNYINNDNLIDSTTLLRNPLDIKNKNSMEKITVKISDVIVPNSDLTKNIFEHCYKTHIGDFIDLHEIFKINNCEPKNTSRSYDIVFVCSDFNRKVKNIGLIESIFNDEKLIKYNKLCVGKNSRRILKNDRDSNIICKDFMSQNDIVATLNNSKIVLVASFIETYSITAIEATQCGCIVLSSKNSACSSTINKFFVIDSYDLSEWTNKIITVLDNYIYFKNIFTNDYYKTQPIENLWTNISSVKNNKINIVCCSIDVPYVGGCATNTYRIIKYLQSDPNLNVYGIFISNNKNDYNPQKLDNIYKINFDEDTEKNLAEIKNDINTKIDNINFVFFKNYKIFPFIKKVFNGTKLIFSPSGLRNISGNTTKEYVMDMDMTNISKNTSLNYCNVDNLYKFIQDNDMYLDDFAIKQSDIVIPNSLLSYDIINNFYPDIPNLSYPVYITNIIYENIHENNFCDRDYDVMFCSYDWKRKCKNYEMVLNIIKSDATKNLKIIVVGRSQIKKYDNDNVIRYEYLNNDKVIDILKSVKVLVIPSKFDSNPNVLVEAISCGCNVVTSYNVGNSENLDCSCIVKNYENVDDWTKTILECTSKRCDYKGPDQNKVISTIKNFFTNDKKFKKSVCVYKIPPEFNNTMNSETLTKFTCVDYIKAPDDTFAYDIINYDIYFDLFYKMSIREKCSSINYIVYDSSIQENMYVNVNHLYPTYAKGVIIWKIKDIESFSYFTNADLYFIRGTYYNFFRQLIPKSAKTILYPATSMKQSLTGNNNYGAFLLTQQKFNVVLYHEDSLYNKIYNAEKFVIFNKFATDKFVCWGNTREYDICYVATDKQPTKNHDLFLNFVLYLEAIKRKTSVIYVGNLEKIILDTGIKNITDNLSHVKLENRNYCNHEELIEIFNNTKINILFSGRDALPRVVSESSACGCFNIALDTLSDGKSFYDGKLGILIGDPSVKKILKPASSLSYVHDFRLWNNILPWLDMTYDHSEISLQFKQKYTVDKIVDEIFN